jgi:ribosomal protein L33
MAKKAQKGRTVVHLECTTCGESGVPGVSRYSTRKYCRFERKHTLHKQTK